MAINALFIVEGGRRERDLVNHLITRMLQDSNIKVCPFSVCGNIHMLYNKIIEMGGFANVRDVLLSLSGVSEEDRALLNGDLKFAYTYLIFDLDLQNYDISIRENIVRGLDDAWEMLNYFNDETDDTVGKLYINYPMVESYRDHNSDLEDYLKRTVPLAQCIDYKRIVGRRGDNRNISKYDANEIHLLSDFNLAKAGYIVEGNAHPNYEDYFSNLGQKSILKAEERDILAHETVDVLNSSMLISVDYKGKAYFGE